MSKIKITLANGTIIEKPLVTAFKGNFGTYMVLDDERSGNMGLPVILVSKIQDNRVSSIVDPNEWNAVKENLRNLINGMQADYITPAQELSGDDNYCSQLTLPVDYFDTLKNNYKPIDGEAVSPIAPVSPVGPMEQPASPTPGAPPVAPAPVNPAAPVSPSIPEAAPAAPAQPMPEAPAINPAPVSPVGPMEQPVSPTPEVPPVAPAPVNPAAPVSPSIPEAAPAVPTSNAPDFSQDKEAFLKACENMFDALVSKFNNK